MARPEGRQNRAEVPTPLAKQGGLVEQSPAMVLTARVERVRERMQLLSVRYRVDSEPSTVTSKSCINTAFVPTPSVPVSGPKTVYLPARRETSPPGVTLRTVLPFCSVTYRAPDTLLAARR